MDELVELVRQALAAEYSGAPNGRVRDLPDRRAIRWYTTIGLVDRPLGIRGRTALYGPRHLQQLVAIKRRQATGKTLAQIQGEMSWITDEALFEVARVPGDLLSTEGPEPDPPGGARHMRFWAQLPAPDPPPELPPPAPSPQETSPPALPLPDFEETVRPVAGVTLGGGAVLLVPHPVSDRDRADIAVAAAPLLDLLAARGLIDGRTP